MRLTSFSKTVLRTKRIKTMIAHTENTTNVKRFVSCFVGQVTFFISRPTSAKKPFMPRRDFGVGMLVGPFGVVGVLDINVRFRLKPGGMRKYTILRLPGLTR